MTVLRLCWLVLTRRDADCGLLERLDMLMTLRALAFGALRHEVRVRLGRLGQVAP